MGGAGKSLLALSVAHRVAGRFPDGRLQLRLGGEHQPTLSAQEALDRLLRALDVPTDRVEGYRVALQGRRVLLLLDNVTGVDQVRPLLPRVPGCAVLLTSRDVLADLGDVKRVPVELLVDRSLAQLSGPTHDRYRLHDLRVYAHDRLNDDEEREALDRALRWYRDRLQRAADDAATPAAVDVEPTPASPTTSCPTAPVDAYATTRAVHPGH